MAESARKFQLPARPSLRGVFGSANALICRGYVEGPRAKFFRVAIITNQNIPAP